MALLKEANRREKAQALNAYLTQGTNAINQLKGIKAGVSALKDTVIADDDFAVEDQTDVQSVIDQLLAGIASI
jgi:hypothetical protein